MSKYSNYDFVVDSDEAVTSPSVGVHYADTVSLQVEGDFASVSIKLQGRMSSAEEWNDISVINMGGLAKAESITAKGIYQASCSAVDLIQVVVASVSGGAVSVLGRLVAEGE